MKLVLKTELDQSETETQSICLTVIKFEFRLVHRLLGADLSFL